MSKVQLVGLSFTLLVIVWLVLSALLLQSQLISNVLLSVFFAWNLAALLVFGVDKLVAGYKGLTRLPEVFFYLVAIIGGAIGVLMGVFILRHKVNKPGFVLRLIAILACQILAVIYLEYGW